MRTGESFNHFDCGAGEDRKRYGMMYPAEYNLTPMNGPVVLAHADNDPFAPPEVLLDVNVFVDASKFLPIFSFILF
jgi:hypothetical protein